MSWRQATEAIKASTTAPNRRRNRLRHQTSALVCGGGADGLACRVALRLMRNFGHLSRLQGRQKIAGPAVIEQRVRGFDAQEKPVARSQRESRHIEDRMVWHGQAAKAQEAAPRKSKRSESSSRT